MATAFIFFVLFILWTFHKPLLYRQLTVIPNSESRKNLMKLSHRMMRTFCFNISCSGGQSWTVLSETSVDTVRITTRKSIDPGQPSGLILCAVSTTWLPFSHQQVFEFLRDERRRSQVVPFQLLTTTCNTSFPTDCTQGVQIFYWWFSFLKLNQKQLDVLSGGTSSQEIAHIANGSDPGNCISLLRINVSVMLRPIITNSKV